MSEEQINEITEEVKTEDAEDQVPAEAGGEKPEAASAEAAETEEIQEERPEVEGIKISTYPTVRSGVSD